MDKGGGIKRMRELKELLKGGRRGRRNGESEDDGDTSLTLLTSSSFLFHHPFLSYLFLSFISSTYNIFLSFSVISSFFLFPLPHSLTLSFLLSLPLSPSLSKVVMKLLSLFSDELYSRLLDWIYKFSRNTKVVYRVFALDIVAELLNQPLRCPKEGTF